jgi:hypothetical protein
MDPCKARKRRPKSERIEGCAAFIDLADFAG